MGDSQPKDQTNVSEEPGFDQIDTWNLPAEDSRLTQSSKPLVIGDMYIFLLDPSKSPRTKPFLAKLVEFRSNDSTAHFEDVNGEIIVFAYESLSSDTEEAHHILLDSTPGYEIIDKAVVTSTNLPIQGDEAVVEITEEPEEYVPAIKDQESQEYSLSVKQDDLLFNYLRALHIYDQPHLIEEAYRRISDLMEMIEHPKSVTIDSLIQDTTIPQCLIPITDSQPKTYEEGEILSEIAEDMRQFESSSLTYNESLMIILKSLNTFPLSEDSNGYLSHDYVGPFLRDCIQNDTCVGIDGDMYAYDERRNASGIKIPVFEKDELGNDTTHFVEAYPPQPTAIDGLLEEPYDQPYYGLTDKLTRNLSLRDRLRIHKTYDLLQLNLSKIIANTQIIGHIAGIDTLREINGQNFISHRFLQNMSRENFHKTLFENTSRPTDIIQGLREMDRFSSVTNIKDIDPHLAKYGLTYRDLTKEGRKMIDQIIYQNNSKKCLSDKVDLVDPLIQIKSMSVGSKIKIAREFILSIKDVRRKNDLLKEFMKVYCRECDKSYEDNRFLYNKYANEALLCKHYQYLVRIDNENDVFNTMKSIYGTAPIDGKIYCKVCGEAMCDEDASLHEGFVDDVAIVSRDVIEKPEDADKRAYIDSHSRDQSRITTIASALGIELSLDMIYDLLKIMNRADPNEVTMKRYNFNGSQHPRIISELAKIKTQESDLKKSKSKSKESKKALQLLRQKKEKISSDFKRWLIDTNRFLLLIGGIALVIQTAVPQLNLKHNEEFRVIDSKNGGFRAGTLHYLEVKMKRICKNYSQGPFWKSAHKTFDEPQGIPSFQVQLQKAILYLMDGSFPEIMKRIQLYDDFTEYERGLFLRPEWSLFRPHSRNQLNRSVNECVSLALIPETLKRVVKGYLVENISLIRSINDPIESVAKICDIPTLEIVQNPAFLKLFRLSVSCYGIHPNKVLVTILIHQLLETSSYRSEIEAILIKYGWKQSSGGFANLDFRVWRTKIIPDILQLSSKEGSSQIVSCANNETTCNSFIHRSINNFDYPMLTTFPKRHYQYQTLRVFPSSSFTQLSQEQPTMLQKLFSLYKINKINKIVRYQVMPDPLDSYFVDLDESEDIAVPTLQSLSQDESTFRELLSFKRSQGSLPYIPTLRKKDRYDIEDYALIDQSAIVGDSRLLRFQKNLYSHDESESINKQVRDILEKKSATQREINETFSQYLSLQTNDIEQLSLFIIQSDMIDEGRRERLKRLLGVKWSQESLSKIIYQYVNSLDDLMIVNEIKEVDRILSLLSESNYDIPTVKCPREWKQSDSEQDKIISQLQRTLTNEAMSRVPSEMMIHDEILKPVRNRPQISFESYRIEDDSAPLYFEGLLRYLHPYLKNIYLLVGDDRSLYTSKLAKIYSRYNLTHLFSLIIRYMNDLKDDESEIAEDANLLYAGLDQDRYETLQRSLRMISTLLIDLLTHLLMSYFDPQWIFQNRGNTLDKRLAKQREREKGERIKTLDQASGSSEREIMTAKQNAGLTNWFLEASQAAEKYTSSDDYRNATDEERRTMMIAIFGSKGIEVQDIPDLPIPDIRDEPDPNDDERDGYDYRDAMDLENDDLAPDEDLNDDYDRAVEAVFNE